MQRIVRKLNLIGAILSGLIGFMFLMWTLFQLTGVLPYFNGWSDVWTGFMSIFTFAIGWLLITRHDWPLMGSLDSNYYAQGIRTYSVRR